MGIRNPNFVERERPHLSGTALAYGAGLPVCSKKVRAAEKSWACGTKPQTAELSGLGDRKIRATVWLDAKRAEDSPVHAESLNPKRLSVAIGEEDPSAWRNTTIASPEGPTWRCPAAVSMSAPAASPPELTEACRRAQSASNTSRKNAYIARSKRFIAYY